RIAYEDDYRSIYRRRNGYGGRYNRIPFSRIDGLDHYERDRNYDRFYGRDGYDRLDSILRTERYRDGRRREFDRSGYDRLGLDHYHRDFQRDFVWDLQGVARLPDVGRDRIYDRYGRQGGYDRYRPRGYYNDRYPRQGPRSFFGQTRYPAEGRFDRGYGRPVNGRIDGYEIRNYGWNLGNTR
ncbi:hypothetical protein BIW11_06962, partial [Tropilaelaps mercedesae]